MGRSFGLIRSEGPARVVSAHMLSMLHTADSDMRIRWDILVGHGNPNVQHNLPRPEPELESREALNLISSMLAHVRQRYSMQSSMVSSAIWK
jgi:hypothetical protein